MNDDLERILPRWIAARRWYRTKTKHVQSARIVASFVLKEASARIALVELALADGEVATYVLPLALLHGAAAARFREERPQAVIMPTPEGLLVDGLAVEAVLQGFLRAIVTGETVTDGQHVLAFHPLPGVEGAAALPARLATGEQTNSSILYGERFVGKVVRKLEAGESPDLELGRFLTAVGYRHTPPLAGFVDVRAGKGPAGTLGLLHGFVANHGDSWTHVLRVLDPWLAAATSRGAAPEIAHVDVVTRASQPIEAEALSAVGPYAGLAEKLGQRVGAMHVALASRPADPVFAPEPLDAETRAGIVEAVRRDLARVLDAVGAHGGALPDAARTSLAAVRRRVKSFAARLGGLETQPDAGVRMRVHGDLHLGQVLFTGDDFVIIDFEGEPARSLEERRAKRSPLVDVAGMLRSFHYASVAALRARPEGSRAALAPWAALWHRVVAASFVRGWLASVRGSVVLPAELDVTRALLGLFLLEKGIYEVHYELNNRPDWVDIPLEGLREIVSHDGDVRNSRIPVAASPTDASSPAVTAFFAGTATHAHTLFGAHPNQDGATDFAVWAPHAAEVSVVGDFDAWNEGAVLEEVRPGLFAGRVPGARAGQRYTYRIAPAGGGEPFDKADPFAVAGEPSPGTASVITVLAYAWGDSRWMEDRFQGARLDRPMSIYEVHLGSWRRQGEEGSRPLSYREIAAPLAQHAKELGFTHVELMPVLEHPFYGSWGYGVTGFFAATSRYGSPCDLMFLVDTLHQAGLGVIFDWVPAHFARDLHGLARFDGAPTFEPDDPAQAVHPTWETGLFDFARPEVRSFLLSSATFWIETFHADGLRVDGVESILYANHASGPLNEAGVAFLRQLTSALKTDQPAAVLAAEDSSSFPGVTRPVSEGGLGFDLKWDMGLAHDLRRYLARDPIERSHHQDVLTFRSVYQAKESYVIPLSHDDVSAERGGSLVGQMHGDAWQRFANLRLLYTTAWAEPGKKLLFMGNEFGQEQPWHHDRSLDWHLAHEPAHAGIARLVGDLNRLYRELPALHAGDASEGGFEWIDGSNAAMSVMTFLRRGRGDEDVVLVACNFTPVPRLQYRIGVPRGGAWREVLSSDATIYGGSGHGNLGGVEAVPYPWNGRPSSVMVTLPPLGAIILARG